MPLLAVSELPSYLWKGNLWAQLDSMVNCGTTETNISLCVCNIRGIPIVTYHRDGLGCRNHMECRSVVLLSSINLLTHGTIDDISSPNSTA